MTQQEIEKRLLTAMGDRNQPAEFFSLWMTPVLDDAFMLDGETVARAYIGKTRAEHLARKSWHQREAKKLKEERESNDRLTPRAVRELYARELAHDYLAQGHQRVSDSAPRTQDRQESAGNAMLLAESRGLPALAGTDKQTSWAATIREEFAKIIADLQQNARALAAFNRDDLHEIKAHEERIFEVANRAQALLQEQTQATFWIDAKTKAESGSPLYLLSQRFAPKTNIGAAVDSLHSAIPPDLKKTFKQRVEALRAQDARLVEPEPVFNSWREEVRFSFDKATSPKELGMYYADLYPKVTGKQSQGILDEEETKALARINKALNSDKSIQKSKEPSTSKGSAAPTAARARITVTPKGRGGARPGAGRPAKDPTKVLPVRIKETTYNALFSLANNAGLSLSAFVGELLERKVKREK